MYLYSYALQLLLAFRFGLAGAVCAGSPRAIKSASAKTKMAMGQGGQQTIKPMG